MTVKKKKQPRYQIDESGLDPADFEKIDLDELTRKLATAKPKEASKKRQQKGEK